MINNISQSNDTTQFTVDNNHYPNHPYLIMILQLIIIASNSIVNGNNVGDIECIGCNIKSNSAVYLISNTQSGISTCENCQSDNLK